MKKEPKRIQEAKKHIKKDLIYEVDDALKLAKKDITFQMTTNSFFFFFLTYNS